MAQIIREYIPEEPVTFTDWVDDDGLGNGPFKMVLTIWREGDVCHADWTGTDDQAPGSINFHIHEGLCKLFLGIYLIMAFDPEILFNDGIYDVFEMTLPEGSLLNPKFPAPLSNRLNVHTRLFDCISGALGQKAPELSMAAGYGTQPVLRLLGLRRAAASTSSSSSCCSAGCRPGTAATGSTGTRGGRCSARRRPSTPRATTRCGSRATSRRATPGAPGSTAAAPGSRRPTCSPARARSPYDDRARSRRGGSTAGGTAAAARRC